MEWVFFKTVDDRASVELISDHLKKEGVPCKIDTETFDSGIEGFHLYVPMELLHRAKWLTADAGYTDEELNYLSTGNLGDKQ